MGGEVAMAITTTRTNPEMEELIMRTTMIEVMLTHAPVIVALMIDIHTSMEGPIEVTNHEAPMMTIHVEMRDTRPQEAMVTNMDLKAVMMILEE
jgi:hypothetical protein